ncbi:MAG: CheY-like superfamily [Bacillota bacterium]|jgi:YesN/AraC family two-component response regulator|nr:CheY-like superfamily [Bacillota bacterium]
MCKILLVEDEEIEIMALKDILLNNMNNIEIVGTATNGYEAINILERNQIDLVFIDINIPGITGLEVIRYIKNNYPKIIVIVMTAYNNFKVEHAVLKLKVEDYLIKPVKPSLIIETLKQYFYNKEEDYNYSFFKSCIKELRNEMIEQHSYSNSVSIIKKLIFEIYENTSFNNNISKYIIDFADEIINICIDLKLKSIKDFKIKLDKITNIRIQKYAKYEMYSNFVRVIDNIFDEIIEFANSDNNEMDINKVLNYIDRNIKKGISLDEIAEYSNLSIYYMSKLFKKEKNINFINYIIDKKMELAKEILVNTNNPIINIAIELSYEEANYFSKVFKKNVGMTPTEYREKYSKILVSKI